MEPSSKYTHQIPEMSLLTQVASCEHSTESCELSIPSLNADNYEDLLVHVKKSTINTLIILVISVTPEQFSTFLEHCPELNSLALVNKEYYKSAVKESPYLSEGKWIFLGRNDFQKYENYIAPLFKSLQFKKCVYVDSCWAAYTETVRRDLQEQFPDLEIHHCHIPVSGRSYLKSMNKM